MKHFFKIVLTGRLLDFVWIMYSVMSMMSCVWKKFLNYNGRPFLSEDCSYAFIINIDWFQPYKHLTYSVGVDLSSCNQPSKITALSVAEYLSRRNYSRPF